MSPEEDELRIWLMAVNLWKPYVCIAVEQTNRSDPRSWNKAWKNSGPNGIWTHDLCDTGAALHQLN